jgi:cysteinyl-tRNA synthetase
MLERLLKLACGAAMVLALCAVSSDGDDPFGARSAQASYAVPNDFVYQLQNVNLSAIGKTKFDLVVMDYSRDGSDERKFSAEEIEALKTSPGGRKRVLAYMSIGEAEDYRFY